MLWLPHTEFSQVVHSNPSVEKLIAGEKKSRMKIRENCNPPAAPPENSRWADTALPSELETPTQLPKDLEGTALEGHNRGHQSHPLGTKVSQLGAP